MIALEKSFLFHVYFLFWECAQHFSDDYLLDIDPTSSGLRYVVPNIQNYFPSPLTFNHIEARGLDFHLTTPIHDLISKTTRRKTMRIFRLHESITCIPRKTTSQVMEQAPVPSNAVIVLRRDIEENLSIIPEKLFALG